MMDNDEDCDSNKRSSAENRGWSITSQVLGDRTIGRSGDAVCDLHHAQADEEHEFLH
jgi:hypothetical protein